MAKSKNRKTMAKSRRKPAPAVAASWTNDLVLTLTDNILTSTVSPNAKWAGIQKYDSPNSNEGLVALFEAQRYYQVPPGEGETTSAPAQGSGYYRGWSYDEGSHTHVSNWVQIP